MGPNLVRLSIRKPLAEPLIGTPLNGGLSNHAKRNLPLATDEIPLDDALSLQLQEFIDENR